MHPTCKYWCLISTKFCFQVEAETEGDPVDHSSCENVAGVGYVWCHWVFIVAHTQHIPFSGLLVFNLHLPFASPLDSFYLIEITALFQLTWSCHLWLPPKMAAICIYGQNLTRMNFNRHRFFVDKRLLFHIAVDIAIVFSATCGYIA